MFWFLFKLVLAVVLAVGAKVLGGVAKKAAEKEKQGEEIFPIPFGGIRLGLIGLALIMLAWAIIGTSVVWVSSGNIATIRRVYVGTSLPPGRIVALDGELGPQARILTAGFHLSLFINLTCDIDEVPVFSVPNGKCAIMSARDGLPNQGGSAFAEPWSDEAKQEMANNAIYFLTVGKGQRGPQTTTLTPGSYTINPFLWEEPKLIDASRVEQGTVGVVKSSVLAKVDFGSFKRDLPKDNTLKVLTSDKLPRGAAGALLVPVGAIGVWEEPLPNGLYYINTNAYRVTMVPTVAQVYEYKGGYKRRAIQVSVDNKGQITEKLDEVEVAATPTSADTAIFTKPEGWDVPQELRVLAQVSPEMAPFVVASLGLTQENAAQVIEDRVVTPIIRSVVRDVQGGAQISFKSQKAVLDKEGNTILNEQGEPKTQMTSEFRAVKVMDLLENRPSLEEAIEDRAKPESLKEGVTINEVRLAESAIPAELLIARKREQLAQQLAKAWKQEELAQGQRQKTENSRAQADQQTELVKAEIANKAADERAKARQKEGKGEQDYLTAIAMGQREQASVLGNETTAKLQMFQQALKAVQELAEKNPEVLIKVFENPQKFVPNIVVNGGGGLEGASAIFGHLMGGRAVSTTQPTK
jgi:hypothetical protein